MSDAAIIYERGVLYEEVWTEPIRTVAKRYGVSDVALAKTCRRLRVPVPGRGYWAKKKAGRAPERPPLPPLEKGQPETVIGERFSPRPAPEPIAGLEAAEPLELPAIVVQESLEHPHKLITLSARYLRKAKPSYGLVSVAPQRTCLDIEVSPESLERALCIMDALLKGIEAAGLTVEVAAIGEAPAAPSLGRRHGYGFGYDEYDPEPQPPRRVTRVLYDEEWIEFRLVERVRRIRDEEPRPPKGASRSWQPRQYDYEPTGELALELTNVSAPGVRAKWKENRKRRLEEMLTEFVSCLPTAALSFKLEREAEERRKAAAREAELRRTEEQLRRWEEEERRREEEQREQALEAEAAQWRRAQDVREYVRAALTAVESRELSPQEEQAERDRLTWALAYADKIDPLRP